MLVSNRVKERSKYEQVGIKACVLPMLTVFSKTFFKSLGELSMRQWAWV